MEEVIVKFKNYLKAINRSNEDDFQKSKHHDVYFSLNKLVEITKKDINPSTNKLKEFGSYKYILFSEIYDILKTITDVREYDICDLLCVFGLTSKFETNGLEILIDNKNVGYNGQFLFTHTLSKFLQNNFPLMTLSIEDNFLKRLDKDIIINKTKGMRVDIVINEAKIVIEYDEYQHEKYDNAEKDELRDCVIKAYGYQVLRFKEGSNLIKFFAGLTPIIKEQEFIENPKLLGKFIIEFFINKGYAQDVIQILTSEIVEDIVNNTSYENIGKTPRNIRLDENIFNWLYIDSKSDKDKITQILINDINEPYDEISSENSTDYILSPDAFEEILMYINAEEYDSVIKIRRAYIAIKKKLLQYVYEQTEKLKNLMDTRVKLLKYVSNEGYNRGVKDTFTKCKKLEEEKEELISENNVLKKIIDNSIPKNGRGFIKKNIEPIENKLIVNSSIIAEIPELIYTGSTNDYVEENEIKIIFEQNKKKLRINISYKDCINLIKKKLSAVNNTNLLVSDIIFCCKIVFMSELKKKATKKIIIDDDENDDDNEI